MYNRKTMIALAGMVLLLAGTLYLAPALARPYWYQPTEDGGAPPYVFSHCYVNGTWGEDEEGALQPPCWDPETGEYIPRGDGAVPDWCPYGGRRTGATDSGLGGMWRNWFSHAQRSWGGFRGAMSQGSGGFRRGGGCSRTG